MFERAMKRLHARKEDTVVFSGALAGIEQAKAAGFRTVAVSGSAGAADWAAMQEEADQAILHYGEFFAQMA